MQRSAPQLSGICAVVVSYNPPVYLLDNLEKLKIQAPEVVLIDNGSGASSAALLKRAERDLGIKIIHNQKNVGIAAALNMGIRHAIREGYEWLATFDQDSTITPRFFEGLL